MSRSRRITDNHEDLIVVFGKVLDENGITPEDFFRLSNRTVADAKPDEFRRRTLANCLLR